MTTPAEIRQLRDGVSKMLHFLKSMRGKSGCWNFPGAKDRYGYVPIRANGKRTKAHRLAYIISKGPITKPQVCHRCDNPSCVRPSHLFVGTNRDNVLDAIKKKRWPSGSEHKNAKLTESEVLAIRADSRSIPQIARQYGMGESTIGRIKSREAWRHVP
jgi:hypothetical protein